MEQKYAQPEYEFVLKDEQIGIKCNHCGLASFNPNDIKQLFCGNCEKYHTYVDYSRTNDIAVVIYTIYKKPDNETFVCLRSLILSGRKEPVRDYSYGVTAPDADMIRKSLKALGLVKLMRSPEDAPDIIESWI